MINLLKGLLWLLIIPESIGLGVLKYSKRENRSMIFALILGYILGFAIFEFLAIPMTFLRCSFNTLAYSWMSILIILFFISIKLNIGDLGRVVKKDIIKLVKLPKILTLILAGLIILQCYIPFRYMHEDYDDSNFLAKATISKDTNTLYKYDDIGVEYESFPSRHVLSPFPIYTATLSVAIGIHPLILARTVYPVIFIFLAYMIYAMIGNVLFKDNKEKSMVFLIILSLLYIWGAYSVYSNFVFLLYRIWQGKAILANIIIPFIWLIFLKYINENSNNFYWFILLITLWGADLLSSMALSLCTLCAAICALIWAIRYKKPSYLLKVSMCCIPSVIYGVIYLFIK